MRRSEEFANHAHDVMSLAGRAVQVDFKKIGHGSDGARPKTYATPFNHELAMSAAASIP